MIVERSETLEMLLTDARSLERALQQAGLKADPGSVSFELAADSHDAFAQGDQSAHPGDDDASGQSADAGGTDEGTPSDGTPLPNDGARLYQVAATGQLDVRV